ncbi:MAG: HD domain-containing protein [Candidatus Saccharimonadales bacterium]
MGDSFSHREIVDGDFLPIVRYSSLHERYVDSSYGLHHATQPARYSQDYAYDRGLMIEDLGDDVHPVRHMSYTEAVIVRPLLAVQNKIGDERFDVGHIMALRVAALLHDIGECEHPEIHEKTGCRAGDVSWEIKTESDGSSETVIRQYLYRNLYGDVPAFVLSAADDIIDHREGSLPRETFNTAERLGYYKTGLKAGEVALRLSETRTDEDDLRFTQLGRLALRVTNNHRQFLHERSERFPYLEEVLKTSARLDERIHAKLDRFASKE